MTNLRHGCLKVNLKNMNRKFQVEILNNNGNIHVKKKEVIKLVLNSYFLTNEDNHIFQDIVR